ncbi:MAG: hypothetical protein ACI4UY_07820, partial [Kiritimatiellia bacterium]
VERPLPTLGVNQPAGKPQIRNNVHYKYENASHPSFIGVRRTSALKKWVNSRSVRLVSGVVQALQWSFQRSATPLTSTTGSFSSEINNNYRFTAETSTSTG